MKRQWKIAALAALVVAPAWLGAQGTPRRARPRVERAPTGVFSFSGNRGRIGVVVNTEANADSDKIGARIDGVTPGGPAAKAGLKAGDVITKFNGTALAGAASEEREESGPGMKLIELARALDPGDTVQVEYRRGAETKKATLVAEEVESAWSMVAPRMIEPRVHIDPDFEFNMEPDMRGFAFAFGEPWGRLQLVTLNADLGEYFGTKEGVLVVKAGGDSTLPLKSGDVILAIGGRKPTSPEHAMRILRSYDRGEAVAIDVMRKQKRMTVNWTVPDEERRFRTRSRDRQEPSLYRVLPKARGVQRMKVAGARVI